MRDAIVAGRGGLEDNLPVLRSRTVDGSPKSRRFAGRQAVQRRNRRELNRKLKSNRLAVGELSEWSADTTLHTGDRADNMAGAKCPLAGRIDNVIAKIDTAAFRREKPGHDPQDLGPAA